MTLPLIRPSWPAPDNVVAFCSTRLGGVSHGCFSELNVGTHVGDKHEHVAVNRQRLPYSEQIVWLEQIHSATVIRLPSQSTVGDAAITQSENVFCAVMTADCVPILVCDANGTEVAAIHAGWKGLRDHVIANTLAQFRSNRQHIMAWIGPCISQSAYEVDRAVSQFFDAYPSAIRPSPRNKVLLDLSAIAELQLRQNGVEQVYQSGLCTYSDPKQFFSHRRSCHDGEQSSGRIVSAIGIVSR